MLGLVGTVINAVTMVVGLVVKLVVGVVKETGSVVRAIVPGL
jgi:hypothetical protein